MSIKRIILSVAIIVGTFSAIFAASASTWTNVQTDGAGNLYAPANINASGTITENGVALPTSTGVTSFNGATGTVTYAPSTTIPVSFVSSFNGATGTVSYAPSTTIPTNNNQLTNGAGYLTTSPSSLNINSSTIFIPNQAYLTTYGCPFGFSSDHTVDTCVNDLYNNNSSTASSTDFYLANGTYTWTDPTGFKFTNAGEQAQLHCAAGDGTRLVDNAATGTIGTIAWGTVPTAGAGVFGCAFFGANTVNTNSSSSGNIGWLVNAPYVTFRDNHFTQFSVDIYLNTNTYLDTLQNNYFGYAGGYEVYAPNSSNSGESNTFTDNTFATLGNSTTTHCVYLNTQSTNISGKSNDGCTIEVGGLAHVSMSGVHHETINAGSYGAYYPVVVDAGGVLTEVNGDYQQDGTGANVASGFINNAGHVHETNATLWANPSSTPNFIVNTGAGTSTQVGTDNTKSPGTTIANNISQFTNDSGYITTSTFNLTGTANYFPQWNAAGTSLNATSAISTVINNGSTQVGISGTSTDATVPFYITNSSSSGDAQMVLQNFNNGNGAYIKIIGSSTYVSDEFVGGAVADWKLGMFGNNNLVIFDSTNGRTIFSLAQGAPTSSLTVSSAGLVTIGAVASGTLTVNGTTTVNGASAFNGHIGAATTTLTASCGTVLGNDNGGAVTFTTAQNNCTVTFNTPWNVKPICVATNATSSANIIRSQVITTSTFQFLDTSNFPTTTVTDYMCRGNPN